MLRKRSPPAAFFAGTRRLQSDLIQLSVPPVTSAQCAALAAELESNGALADAEADVPDDPATRFPALVIRAHAALLRERGFYLPQPAELIRQPGGGGELAVAIPKIPSGTDISLELFRRLTAACAQAALQGSPASAWLAGLRTELAKVPAALIAAAHMVRAAYEMEIPILEWHSVFLQVGYGRNAVALSGSISQDTSSIGVHLAREKAKSNVLLARAGFPVADGALARNLKEANDRAAALGYPVVVKPADRDGGKAVTSDIRTPAELEEAFARARAESGKVLVEKHIEGTDYRMLFHNDELLVALERTPGGVVGNGTDTVARLLEQLNREPGRSDDANALLHTIAFDEEARLTLRRQELTLDSIPADGQFVPLRRAANHALGGRVRRIEAIHPDNIDLARRAMRLLRLDIAGLDVIFPDIERSWREAGGAIVEVNAQPYIGEPVGRDLYKMILERLVPQGGRIPLVLVVGEVAAATVKRLERRIEGLAVIDAGGARRGGYPLSAGGLSWSQACQAALYDTETRAALCILDPDQTLPSASPADRFSAVFVLEARDEHWHLMTRADELYAVPAAAPALRKGGFDPKPVQGAALGEALAAALAGEPIPASATAKSARSEKAPPARRKRQ